VVVVEVEVERLVFKMKGHGLSLERQMVQVMVAFLLAFTFQQQPNAEQEKKVRRVVVPGMHLERMGNITLRTSRMHQEWFTWVGCG